MPVSKNIAFDVVGTLVSYDSVHEAMGIIFGERGWWSANTCIALFGRKTPVLNLIGPLFYRALRHADIKEPCNFAGVEEVGRLVGTYRSLKPCHGAAECAAKLRDGGFTVWAFTAGDRERVEGYFAQAGIDLPAENLVACHSLSRSKPYPDAYRHLHKELSKSGTEPWFTAAHTWDVSTARTIGLTGAYAPVLDGEPLHKFFGDMDVVANNLVSMAYMIIAAEQETRRVDS